MSKWCLLEDPADTRQRKIHGLGPIIGDLRIVPPSPLDDRIKRHQPHQIVAEWIAWLHVVKTWQSTIKGTFYILLFLCSIITIYNILNICIYKIARHHNTSANSCHCDSQHLFSLLFKHLRQYCVLHRQHLLPLICICIYSELCIYNTIYAALVRSWWPHCDMPIYFHNFNIVDIKYYMQNLLCTLKAISFDIEYCQHDSWLYVLWLRICEKHTCAFHGSCVTYAIQCRSPPSQQSDMICFLDLGTYLELSIFISIDTT